MFRGSFFVRFLECGKEGIKEGERKMYNGIRFTKPEEMEHITETAFRILEEVGVKIESSRFIEILKERFPGGLWERRGRVCFQKKLCQEVFFSGQGHHRRPEDPSVACRAEIYEGYYLDPEDNEHKEWTEERLISYISLAKALPNVDSVSMLGCPLRNLKESCKPLYEKLYCFRYGVEPGGAIWNTALCGPILEMCQIYAEEKGLEVQRVFSGCVYLVTPLKLGHVEAEQLLWFRDKGLRAGIGVLASLGLSVPVTMAGGLAEHIAEQVFIGIVNRALFGEKGFGLSSMLSCADFRTAAFQYGRPEQVLMNNALSDIAAYYDLPFSAHEGLTDAKLPGYEAGIQKLGTALANFSKGGVGYLAGGLLSIDEVCSPVQLVLDGEAAGYLKRIAQGFAVDGEALAFEALRECVEEGLMFLESEHTLRHWRENLWMPRLFSKEMYADWARHRKTAEDLARETALAHLKSAPLEPVISEDCFFRLKAVIHRAEKDETL